jgi:hypothetical protein
MRFAFNFKNANFKNANPDCAIYYSITGNDFNGPFIDIPERAVYIEE